VANSEDHFLCLNCFAALGESRGISPTSWIVDADNPPTYAPMTLAQYVSRNE